jgi:hypothetical protein
LLLKAISLKLPLQLLILVLKVHNGDIVLLLLGKKLILKLLNLLKHLLTILRRRNRWSLLLLSCLFYFALEL